MRELGETELSVAVSAAERSIGILGPEAEQRAYAGLAEHGCIVLRDLFPSSVIDGMYGEYMSRYGNLDSRQIQTQALKLPPNRFLEVGQSRYEIAVRMSGAFGAPNLFANDLLRGFLTPRLGQDMRLSGFTIVVAYPGAELQHPHRDHAHLFGDVGVGSDLPVYAVNVAIPLIDVDLETGPTGIWLGSHRWPAHVQPREEDIVTFSLRRGDCLLLDYRTFHAGMPNRSERVRPILYMPYTRTWFFDEVNHFTRTSLDMPLAAFRELPESLHPLLIRAYTQGMRARWPEVDAVVALAKNVD